MKQKQRLFTERFQKLLKRVNRLHRWKSGIGDIKILEFPKDEVMKVCCIGYTKSGKSSLVNLLIQALQSVCGDQFASNDLCYYCPVENRAFTNLLWNLSFGEKNEYVLRLRDDKGKSAEERIELGKDDFEEQLYNFVTGLRDSPLKMKHFLAKYEPQVNVKLNLECLRFFEICDVPGKGETKELNDLVLQQVRKSDIILYVFESNRGNLSQLDQHYIRELKRMTSFSRSRMDNTTIPLEHKILFVGNKTDLNLPSRSYRRRKVIYKKENIQKLVRDLKETVVEKLNEPTMFDGMIEEDQVFLTCSNDQVRAFHHFDMEILSLRDALLKRRDELYFRIPAMVNCDNLLDSIGKSVTLLEGMENKIRCLNDIFRSSPQLRRQVDKCLKDAVEKIRLDLHALFHTKYEIIRDIICEENISPEDVRFNFDHDRIRYAKSYLKNKFDTYIMNETRKIYLENVAEFQAKMFEELSKMSPLANDLFSSSPFFDGVEGFAKKSGCPSLTEKQLYPPNTPSLRKVLLVTTACHALALAAPPLMVLSISLAPYYLLTSPFSALSIPADVSLDTLDDISTRTEFDLTWRHGAFEEVYQNFHKRKGEKKILKHLSTHLEDGSRKYFENLQRNLLQRVEKLEEERGLGKIDVKLLTNSLYVIEVDALTLRHDFLVVKAENEYGKGKGSGPFPHSRGARLGMGSFARVYAGGMFENNIPVAAKIQRYGNNKGKAEICREISVLRRHSSHPGLVKFLSCSHEVPHRRITIFMERCPSNLTSLILDDNVGLIQRLDVARQIASAMCFLNSKGLFHRDLKPENILCNSEKDEVFLCDFGAAKSIGMSLCTHESVGGSNFYLDPVIQCRILFRLRLNYGLKRDVYSMGVLLAELWSQTRIWRNLLSKSYSEFVETPCLVGNHSISREILMSLKMLNPLTKRYEEEDENEELVREYQELIDQCTLLVEDLRPTFQQVEERLTNLIRKLGRGNERRMKDKIVSKNKERNLVHVSEEVIQL